jgi:hypothetical protein
MTRRGEHSWEADRPDPADVKARLAERDERAALDTRTAVEVFLGDPPPWRRWVQC